RASLAGAPKLTSEICRVANVSHLFRLSHRSNLLANLVIQSPGKQPADSQHIDRGAQSAVPKTVFALAKTARTMAHGNFDEPIASGFHQRGNETVHALEWNHRAYAFAPHRFERAPGVAHAVFCVAAAHRVRDAAGSTLHKCVLTLDAITTDKIGSAGDFSEQFWNVGRIIL